MLVKIRNFLIFFIVSCSANSAVVYLDTIFVTFTEANSPVTAVTFTQYEEYGEVSVNRQLSAYDGMSVSQLRFEIQQLEASGEFETGGWNASSSQFGAQLTGDSIYGDSGGGITWLGDGGNNPGDDYPGANLPSPSIKVVDNSTDRLMTRALSGLIDAESNPVDRFADGHVSLSHTFSFTSVHTVSDAQFIYSIALYDLEGTEVPVPPAGWLFLCALAGLHSRKRLQSCK